MADYKISKEGICDLASREGLILTPYLDSVGVKTVGFGSTKSDIPDLAAWPWSRKLTVEEAIKLYIDGLKKYSNAVNNALAVDIKQHQFDALVSVCYNIGIGGMRKSTFMRKVNECASIGEITRAIRMWNKPPEIRLRRQQEAELYANGIYISGGFVTVWSVNPVTHKPIYKNGKQLNLMSYL